MYFSAMLEALRVMEVNAKEFGDAIKGIFFRNSQPELPIGGGIEGIIEVAKLIV